MSTKSSRQVKGKKQVTNEDIQRLFDSGDESDNTLTQEQIKINKKLSESGLLEEGLNWVEKKALFKTVNASVSTAKYEKQVRSSPKPAGASESKERIIPIEVDNEILEKGEVAFTRRIISNQNKNVNKSSNPIVRAFEAIKNNFTGAGSDNKAENQENSQGNIKCNNSEKVVSDLTLNKCNKKNEKISIDLSSDEDSDTIFISKKRPSPPEVERIDSIKKLKMDQNSTKVNVVNSRKPLKTEIEYETKQNNIHFNRRSFQTILNELQRMSKLRKEASAKYKFPVRWGNPIVRNSNERWDGQTIPQKLIDRYQKYLSKNGSEGQLHLSGPAEETFRDCEIDKAAVSSSSEVREKSFVEDPDSFEDKREPVRENSENVPRQYERKAKGRNQIKQFEADEFENVDKDDDEWVPKEVPKKHEKSAKSRKGSNFKSLIDRKPVAQSSKVDNYKIYKSKNSDDVSDENIDNGKGDRSKRESQETSNFDEQNSEEIGGAGDEQVACPICNKSFKTNLIENHATECASKTFQD